MKILQITILVSLFLLLRCDWPNKKKEKEIPSKKERELTERVSLWLSSQKSLYEIMEEIRISCERNIPEIKSKVPNNFNQYFNQIIYEVDYIKKTTKTPQEMIGKINKYFFERLEIVPVAERENILYFFPQFVVTGRIGNCIGISLLYLLVGEKLNIPFYGIFVPGHVFVRYDDGEKRINIETLKKGEDKSESWYLEKYNKNGMESCLLRRLNKKELIGIFFYNIGTILMLSKKYNVSLEHLKIANSFFSDNPEIEGNLALAFDGIGDSDSALKILIKLKKKYPQFENLDKNIGLLQLKLKRYRDAINTYIKICEKEPEVENYYFLALSYYYFGKKDSSLFYLEKSLELTPDYKEASFLKKKIK